MTAGGSYRIYPGILSQIRYPPTITTHYILGWAAGASASATVAVQEMETEVSALWQQLQAAFNSVPPPVAAAGASPRHQIK
jgi:hypothetical protein